jgi:hypothetical protein
MPRELMRLRSVVTVFCITVLSRFEANAQVNVTQEHNNFSRDGVYVDAGFTLSAAANLARDLNFNGTISGNVYAQPLYIEGGPNGPMIIAVTESNNVYALNATTGTIIWQRNLGAPVSLSRLGCGNIDPVGITSTPVVDLASRTFCRCLHDARWRCYEKASHFLAECGHGRHECGLACRRKYRRSLQQPDV